MDKKLAVIGSVHIDIFADTELNIDSGVDLPGEFVLSVGGTAFNVCATLNLLGVPVVFISALRKGSLFTRLILQKLSSLGITHHIILKSHLPESAFLAVRVHGELLFAITATCVEHADEDIIQGIHEYLLLKAVVDCNLSEKCLGEIVKAYQEVYICATSQVKSAKILGLKGASNIKAVFLNQAEAFQIVSLFSGNLSDIIKTYWFITKGADGVTVVTPQGERFDIPNPDLGTVKSTSGAGDAFASGVIYGLEKLGLCPLDAVNIGFQEVKKKLVSAVASCAQVDLEKIDTSLFTDKLTGVYTRTLFEERKHLFKYGCVIIVDIDHFKKINDTYGHQYGDKVLQEVARVIRSCIRADDEIYRYGGEEFVVIVKSPSKMAVDICNRIKSKVQKETIVTVTIGCAPIMGKFDIALKQADKALYQGKQLGRNKVVVIEDECKIQSDIK